MPSSSSTVAMTPESDPWQTYGRGSVTGIVTMIALIEYATWLISEGHTVVYSHWQSTAGIALAFLLSLLEDAAKFNEMAATTPSEKPL